MKQSRTWRRHAHWLACAASGTALAQTVPPVQTAPPMVITGRPVIEANRVDGFESLSIDVSASPVRDLNTHDLMSALRRTPVVTISRVSPVASDASAGMFGAAASSAGRAAR